MQYTVNNTTLRYNITGHAAPGDDRVLLDDATDLTALTKWSDEGFAVEQLFHHDSDYTAFKTKTHRLLIKQWREAGLAVSDDFVLENYHTLVPDFAAHSRALEKTKLLPVHDFAMPIQWIEQRISEICKVPLRVLNPFDKQSVFHFRVIRPQQTDNNPLHRDVWLEDYADCINLYIPIAGSNEQSSLILMPGSHRWAESRIVKTTSGAEINGIKFNVPGVVSINGPHRAVRPNPGDNEVLVFSPYLIHGGAVNLNPDQTRISIEMRLWKNQ